MKTKMYSLFDSKAAVYGTPFFMPNDATALRAFTELVNDRQSTVYKYPEDFTLFTFGEFDDLVGVFDSLKAPLAIVSASAVKRPSTLSRGTPEVVDMTPSGKLNGSPKEPLEVN